MYTVIDTHTGNAIRTYNTLCAAQRAVDRLDNAYGAYRYTVRRNGV